MPLHATQTSLSQVSQTKCCILSIGESFIRKWFAVIQQRS